MSSQDHQYWLTVTRTIRWCAAHRLILHGGKCKRVHGHNYKADISVCGPVDPDTGMVVDFGHLKAMQEWVDQEWDHAYIANPGDMIASAVKSADANQRVYWMPTDHPEPTAENMTIVLLGEAKKLFSDLIVQVRVYEEEHLICGTN